MKKVLSLLLFCSLMSCQKKYCYKCSIAHAAEATMPSVTDTVLCDKTLTEILKYEKDNTITERVYHDNGGYQTNHIKTTTCNQSK